MPQLPQLYPYKPGPIEPIVMPGEIVGIWVNKVYHFRQVVYIEGIPISDPITVDLGAVAAGATSAVAQLTILEMPETEFAQYRALVLDDLSFLLFQGRADQRHKVNNAVATYTRFTNLHDPCGHTTEFYVFEDNFAFMSANNQTDYGLTLARAAFYGFRYVCGDELKQFSWKEGKVPEHWTRVPATAHL